LSSDFKERKRSRDSILGGDDRSDQFEIVRAKRFVRKNASKRHFAFAVVASRIRIAPLRV
jgi:hypothetical protein